MESTYKAVANKITNTSKFNSMIIYYVFIMIICGSYGEISAKWCLYQFEEWTNDSRNNSRKGLNEES